MALRMGYRFFFSYSWKNLGLPLERFFNDLSERVRNLVGGEREEVSFRDRVTMQAGTVWPAGLLEALSTSQTLVCLLSTDYIQSDYCGKEFQIFLDREQLFRGPHPNDTTVFVHPVIWVPVVGTLPNVLRGVQPEDDAYDAEYARRGLESLAKQRDQEAYERFVETLATWIQRAAAGDRLPRQTQYHTIDEIPNAFETTSPTEAQPNAGSTSNRQSEVRCVYVAPHPAELGSKRTNTAAYGEQGGWYWRPFHPTVPMAVGSLVQQMLTEYRYREVLLGDNIDRSVQELREAAQNDDIVLLVVDAWAALIARYREFLEKFDSSVTLNNAVLIPWNEADQETANRQADLEAYLRVLFRSHYQGSQTLSFFKPRVTGIDEFRSVIRSMLGLLRNNIDTYRAAAVRIKGPPLAQIRTARSVVNG